ncbi:DeoR/GlpR family DNA-binding transcription regulator [Arthrobacter sp. 35W]|uniref:DeoR/GlpR family DNA-binding transcription regulator n=1 Tax=Arthrobacter sp. 35W TaxID=1132441 RepID=UPI0003FA4CE6|nr:DeoR/GlpR family DNA-binding transcription regulator [Arthrobacter sp. 35W]
MLAPERQSRILRELQHHEAVRVAELATVLGVSEMTVRRDIEALDTSGLARKIHGGATRLSRLSAVEPGFSSNANREPEAKNAIATAALSLLEPGMTVALTGGTTTYLLATMLHQVDDLTVVTNSLKVAEVIHQQQHSSAPKVIVTGGERTPSEALVGPVARASISRLNTDICFMGVHGIDHERGLTSPNLQEADTNAAFAEATRVLVVLADHSKFNVRSLASIAPLSRVDTIITDDGVDSPTLAMFRPLVNHLLVANDPAEESAGYTPLHSTHSTIGGTAR